MASYTPNYNLKKPADSDSYDIADHNGNMDKIDTALNTLNSNIANFVGEKSWRDNANLNDYKTSGYYPIGTNPTNAPNNAGWGILEVVATRTDTTEQIYTNNAKKFYREFRSNAWSTWQEFALNSKLTATVESGNVTKVGSYYDSLSLIRIGDIKQISMVITGSNTKVPATGNYVKVAGFPASCKSLYGVATTMANLDGHHFLLRVTSSGDLELYNPVQDQAINGSFTFMFI